MLHGLGYASWETRALQEQLGDDFGLWSLDNAGTGRSEHRASPCSIAQLADDAACAVDALGGPLVVIGHSMGGYIAQQLAIEHPEAVRALVLMATSPGGPDAEPVPASTVDAWTEASALSPAKYARMTMPLSFRAGWTDDHPAEFELLLDRRLESPTRQDVWRDQFAACRRFLATGIDASLIPVPTLVIHGTSDRVVPVANGRLLAARTPDVEYHEMRAAGHLLHLEEPRLVSQLINTFMAIHL
jgi:pimeloyl-ACP methyl ester carboxylesterase